MFQQTLVTLFSVKIEITKEKKHIICITVIDLIRAHGPLAEKIKKRGVGR